MKLFKRLVAISMFNLVLLSGLSFASPTPQSTKSAIPSAGIFPAAASVSTPAPSGSNGLVRTVPGLSITQTDTRFPASAPTDPPVAAAETAAPQSAIQTPTLTPPQDTAQTQVPAPTQALPQDTPTPDTRCIITVDGTRYDVTQFRTIHSGGDIFQCGTDMTTVFHAQHNDATLARMAQYRVP